MGNECGYKLLSYDTWQIAFSAWSLSVNKYTLLIIDDK